MAHILLVDDDEFFRQAVKNILAKYKHQVDEAPNGKVARDILSAGPVDLVISDIQMPHFSGVDLLEWSKKNNPEQKFILMTGFAHILETKQAHELGADDFLSKPFKDRDLKEVLDKFFAPPKSEDDIPAVLDTNYCKVHIEEFVSDKNLEYEIYVRLSATKYLKVSHKGGKIDDERIGRFKEKGLHYLYIRKEDFKKHVGFNLSFAKVVANAKAVPKEKKINFMKYTGEVLLESAFVKGVDEDSLNEAKQFIETAMDSITDDEDLFSLLNVLNGHADHHYAHSLGVSMYAVMIAKELDWKSSQTLFKLSVGGLFHDIGKKEINRDLLEKARPLLTQKERSLIETHTIRGKEILEDLKKMPDEIIQIAYQHHEDIAGHGYPRRLPKNEIHPLAKLVHVADVFCTYAIKGAHNDGMDGPAAVEHMEKYKVDTLDFDAFKALQRLIRKKADKAPKAS